MLLKLFRFENFNFVSLIYLDRKKLNKLEKIVTF